MFVGKATKENIKQMFDLWPQALSLDTPEIDQYFYTNSSESKRKADYLWIPLDRDLDEGPFLETKREVTFMPQTSKQAALKGGTFTQRTYINDESLRKETQSAAIIPSQPVGIIELTSFTVEFDKKINNFCAGNWEKFFNLKIDEFIRKLDQKREQFSNTAQVLNLPTADWVLVVTNQLPLNQEDVLRMRLVSALHQELSYLSGIFYLVDEQDKIAQHVLSKDGGLLPKTLREFTVLSKVFSWKENKPQLRIPINLSKPIQLILLGK